MQIDFHSNVTDRLDYACRTARTVLKHKKTLAIWSKDIERLRDLDHRLWTRDSSQFLVHVWSEDPIASETPIVMGDKLSDLSGDVLLLIDDELPADWETAFPKFERIIDVVSTDPKELELSRQRWKSYKALGVKLVHYNRQE